MKLKVEYARINDREKLRVRINEADKPDNIKWYNYVKIKATKNNKEIVCKLHGDGIKEIPISERRTGLIRINEPLRGRLGVKVHDELDFEITKKPKFFAWYYFIRYHPDDVVNMAYRLAIIAIIMGFISIGIAVCS